MNTSQLDTNQINFSKLNGLVPAIVQDADSGTVLMLGFQNLEAIEKTIELGKVTFWSRTKGKLWTKGETSGNTLVIKNITLDCDNDTILYQVTAPSCTCHTGDFSCFGKPGGFSFLDQLFTLIKDRKKNLPTGSYTTTLFNDGLDRIAQKVGEEGVETVIAAKNDNDDEFIGEASDLVFHLQVLCAAKNIEWDQITQKLKDRHQQ